MRTLLPLLLALAVALPHFPAAAQSATPATVQTLTDALGDVAAGSGGTTAPNPTPRLGQMDLVGESVLEGESTFTFSLKVASLDSGTEPPLAESAFYMLHFLQGDVQYAIQAGRIKSQNTGVFATLARYDPAQDHYYAIESLDITADTASATLAVTVPRELIVDSHGAKPYPGTSITGFWVESQSFMEVFTSFSGFAGVPPPTVRDRMPDAGNGTVPVPVLLGPVQTGSARLSSQLPTRQSNGEATTFLFTVDAANVGDHDDRYHLALSGLPSTWKGTLQDEVLAIPAGGHVALPVLVTVPFAHIHGSFQSFRLQMASATDTASHAEMELGVRYPKVPQPAGHHNTLFLHGAKWTDDPTVSVYAAVFAFNTEYAWVNSLEVDDGDQGVAVPADGSFNFVPGVPGSFHWTVPLAPDLAIGLDFDTTANGTFIAAFDAQSPLLQASLKGELVHYVDSVFDEFGNRVGGNRTVLATFGPSAQQDLLPGGKADYALPIIPLPASDLVPYQPRSALVIELNLTGMRPDTAEGRDPPRLLPGGNLALPLREFHDPVDATFASPRLSLRSDSGQDRLANPGKTVVYRLHCDLAAGAGSHTIHLSLAGDKANWAHLLDPADLTMAAGTSLNVSLAVTVPADASAQDTADLIVHAEATDDPSLQALARLYTTVTTGKQVPDEADLAASLDHRETPHSPAAGVLALGLVFALALASRRRTASR